MVAIYDEGEHTDSSYNQKYPEYNTYAMTTQPHLQRTPSPFLSRTIVNAKAYPPNAKTPPGTSSKRGLRAPDGNRTIYDYQYVTLLTSSFTSGKERFSVKSAFIVHLAFQKAVLREIEYSQWLSEMKQRFVRDVFLHLREQP